MGQLSSRLSMSSSMSRVMLCPLLGEVVGRHLPDPRTDRGPEHPGREVAAIAVLVGRAGIRQLGGDDGHCRTVRALSCRRNSRRRRGPS